MKYVLSFSILCLLLGCTVVKGPSEKLISPSAIILNKDANGNSAQDSNGLSQAELALINSMLVVGKEIGGGESDSILAPSQILTPSLVTGSGSILLPSAFRIHAIQGFNWMDGWYVAENNTDTRKVKLRFEDSQGTSLDYDATDPSLPTDKQLSNFPTLTRSHVSIEATGPAGGQIKADLYGPRPLMIPQPKDWMEIEGKGTVKNHPVFNQLDFDAKFKGRADNSEVEGVFDFQTPQPLENHLYSAHANVSLGGFKTFEFKKDGVLRAEMLFQNGDILLKIGDKITPFVPPV